VSTEAAQLGLRSGMTAPQARVVGPEALFRAQSPALLQAAQAALGDLGAAFSPRVELAPGALFLDVADLGRLFESEAQIARALERGAERLGLGARVGLGRDKITARIAALVGEEPLVVPAGREAAFLA